MTWRFPPTGNAYLREVVHAPLFTAAECDRILERLDPSAWEPGGVERREPDGTAAGRIEIDATRRVSKQAVPSFDGVWPLDVIAAAVVEANASYFRFDLTGYSAVDDPAVLRYDSEGSGDPGGYEVHLDIGGVHTSSRKLSFSVQLTDPGEYEGGELHFPVGQRVGGRDRGLILVFPSYMAHGVSDMVSGTRHALVGWVHGPAFR